MVRKPYKANGQPAMPSSLAYLADTLHKLHCKANLTKLPKQLHQEQYALQSKLIGCPLKTRVSFEPEQQENEGYEKRGKNLVNGDSKGSSRQKIDMRWDGKKERFL